MIVYPLVQEKIGLTRQKQLMQKEKLKSLIENRVICYKEKRKKKIMEEIMEETKNVLQKVAKPKAKPVEAVAEEPKAKKAPAKPKAKKRKCQGVRRPAGGSHSVACPVIFLAKNAERGAFVGRGAAHKRLNQAQVKPPPHPLPPPLPPKKPKRFPFPLCGLWAP